MVPHFTSTLHYQPIVHQKVSWQLEDFRSVCEPILYCRRNKNVVKVELTTFVSLYLVYLVGVIKKLWQKFYPNLLEVGHLFSYWMPNSHLFCWEITLSHGKRRSRTLGNAAHGPYRNRSSWHVANKRPYSCGFTGISDATIGTPCIEFARTPGKRFANLWGGDATGSNSTNTKSAKRH